LNIFDLFWELLGYAEYLPTAGRKRFFLEDEDTKTAGQKQQNQAISRQTIAGCGKITAVKKLIQEIILSMTNPTELASTRQPAAG
jgi:hypothetical protein